MVGKQPCCKHLFWLCLSLFIKQMDKQALQAEIQETSDLEDEDW